MERESKRWFQPSFSSFFDLYLGNGGLFLHSPVPSPPSQLATCTVITKSENSPQKSAKYLENSSMQGKFQHCFGAYRQLSRKLGRKTGVSFRTMKFLSWKVVSHFRGGKQEMSVWVFVFRPLSLITIWYHQWNFRFPLRNEGVSMGNSFFPLSCGE